jgi:DnaJ-class molecular chaperone
METMATFTKEETTEEKSTPKPKGKCLDCGGKGSFDDGEVKCEDCKGTGKVK